MTAPTTPGRNGAVARIDDRRWLRIGSAQGQSFDQAGSARTGSGRDEDRPGPGRSDPVLWLAVLLLSGLGLLAIYSATGGPAGDTGFARRQALFLAAAIMVSFAISRVEVPRLGSRVVVMSTAGITTLLLVAVLTPLGAESRGTQGWLPVFGLAIQPAELAKVSLIVTLAAVLAGIGGRHEVDDIRRFMVAVAILAAVSILVLAEGETGSVLVYGVMGAVMLAGVELPKRLLALLLLSGLALGSLVVTSDVLEPYQRDRIESFMDLEADPQGAGYHQRQSLAAIGSGGLLGKGLFNGPQTQLRFLPDQHTDFIFAVIAEELGFLGGLGIIVVNGVILARVLALARPRGDRFAELLCLGVFAYLGFQMVQNVAMNLRLLPITGIPLPFVSYGGSSLLTGLAAIGLVQAVARRRDESGSAARRTG